MGQHLACVLEVAKHATIVKSTVVANHREDQRLVVDMAGADGHHSLNVALRLGRVVGQHDERLLGTDVIGQDLDFLAGQAICASGLEDFRYGGCQIIVGDLIVGEIPVVSGIGVERLMSARRLRAALVSQVDIVTGLAQASRQRVIRLLEPFTRVTEASVMEQDRAEGGRSCSCFGRASDPDQIQVVAIRCLNRDRCPGHAGSVEHLGELRVSCTRVGCCGVCQGRTVEGVGQRGHGRDCQNCFEGFHLNFREEFF